MKVKIGDYCDWVGPYHVADFFKPVFGEERIDRFTDGKVFEKLSDWSMPFFQWWESKKKRNVKIHIDKWDTYSMDHTLSLIILPMLEDLKLKRNGSPFVDDEDVPEALHSTNSKPYNKKDGEVDEFFHQRWDCIIDELIWTMKQNVDDEWSSQYHTGKSDWHDKKVEIDGTVYYEMIQGPNDTSHFDKEGHDKHAERIQKGNELFGKYFSKLWW